MTHDYSASLQFGPFNPLKWEGSLSSYPAIYSNPSQEVSDSLTLFQPPLQLYSLSVIKGKFEFVYKSPLSRYMHNQKLVYRVFILKLGKNPSQLTLPNFCTQVCKQHDPISQQSYRTPTLLYCKLIKQSQISCDMGAIIIHFRL